MLHSFIRALEMLDFFECILYFFFKEGMMIKKSFKLILSFLVLLCITASIIVIFSAPVSVTMAQELQHGIYRITGCDCPFWPFDCGCPPIG